MTLFNAYLNGNHRPIHKWYQYFPIYEKHFERFRNRHVTVFEIGVGQGGSLQLWKGYFGPFARIVGLDIYPLCKQCEEDQVSVRIGSQDDLEFLASVVAEFGPPDIVIDDGSHLQPHVNATFDFLYPQVPRNGVYLVEDLHAAYWPDHGGGLGDEGSFIECAKGYVDAMHADYTDGALPRSVLGDRTTSIHFYDSVVVLEVGEYRLKGNRTTGNPDLFQADWIPQGETAESFARIIEKALAPLQKPGDRFAPRPATKHASGLLQSRIEALRSELSARNEASGLLQSRIETLDSELSARNEASGLLQSRIEALDSELSAGNEASGLLQSRIEALESELSARNEAIGLAQQHVSGLQSRVQSLEAETSLIRASTSWRVTKPLRAVGRLFKT